MLVESATQLAALQQSLIFFQGLASAEGPVMDAALLEGWPNAGKTIGLLGNPANRRNSLVQYSRMFTAVSPSQETSFGFYVKKSPDSSSGELYVVPKKDGTLRAAFRLEMPSIFRTDKYRHCTNPLTDDGPTFLTVHLMNQNGIQTATFARLKDLWRSCGARINQARTQTLTLQPAELAAIGALTVSRAFDCSDIRSAPSPWARFIWNDQGLEGAIAARNLGMNWLAAEENPEMTIPGSALSHGPLF